MSSIHPGPKPTRIPLTGGPPSAQELLLRQRLVRQREAMRAARCPTCGNEPVEPQIRWRQRQDLAITWLHLDGDTLQQQRHCVACQPHDQPTILECDHCVRRRTADHRATRPHPDRAMAATSDQMATQQRLANPAQPPLREPPLTRGFEISLSVNGCTAVSLNPDYGVHHPAPPAVVRAPRQLWRSDQR
jgi:hypothetical protein